MEETGTIEACKEENNETQMKDRETEDTQLIDEKDSYTQIEVAPALIALHPSDHFVVVAVGSELRIFDLLKNCAVSLADQPKEVLHKESIRAVRFSEKGRLLVSAGDDKLVKIWSSDTWQCLCTINSEKRVSAIAVSKDEEYVCFADKFGVVWIVDITELAENQPVSIKKAVAIFGHYCSIITSLEFSPDGRFIVSADRDFKIRASVFPKKPLDGVHEIQSFCLGHSEFVTCLAFVHNPEFPHGYLVSGSGDSTVCLWDVMSGSLLCTSEVGREVGLSEKSQPAVTDLCATPDGSLVAVAIQSLQGILMISCDLSAKTLSVLKVVPVPGETFIPTSVKMMSSGDMLWMVSGASNLPGSKATSFTRVKVVSDFKPPKVLEDGEIPGGEQLLERLQGSLVVESAVFSAVADALNVAMSNLLRKKHYSDDKREFRKKTRNDKKFKQ
ncbi:hypothetical protein RND81_13G142900 [Saponaria officinalis]|uniref:tRNA (guanine-N(7)-)-methyltransferase non-catalytic subunit n=1 Tax=Saponaria officinalis TaxID=3572 RepID=A0AAW1H686_SAPOF